jgi:hypothetical protein
MNAREVLVKVENGYRHPQPADCPDELYELMNTCWHSDPLDRPSFKEILDKLTDIRGRLSSDG